jgi:hypothetical protein
MKKKFNKSEPFGTVDGGGNKLFVRFGFNIEDVISMTRMDFLSCQWLDEPRFRNIRQFCGEYAHLAVPQTVKSLAQIYSAAQLMELYDHMDHRGVSLFYLPEKQVKKITWDIDSKYAKMSGKTDEMDTLIWHTWLRDGYTDNLQHAVRDLALHAEKGRDHKELVRIVNVTLNMMRQGKYHQDAMYTESEFFPDGVDHCVKFMREWCPKFDHIIMKTAAERMKCAEELLRTLGHSRSNVSSGVVDVLVNRSKYPMSTAVASLIDPRTGETHRKSNQKFRSVDEIMRVAGSSPNHGRMGVARSNLYHHAAKNITKARCKEIKQPIPATKKIVGPFRQSILSSEQLAVHKQSMKDVKSATRLCVRYVQRCLQGSRQSDRLF